MILSFSIHGSLLSQDKAVFSFSPGGADEVTGLMLNMFPSDSKFTSIKGLELELSPISPMIIGMSIFHIIELTTNDYSQHYDIPQEINKEIEGVHIGMLNIDPSSINGFEINVLSFANSCNGLSISAINITNEINGVSVGVIRNFAEKCSGVQIGLINESDDLKGFQFGLWNKNNKRSLPFINWNFSDDEESD